MGQPSPINQIPFCPFRTPPRSQVWEATAAAPTRRQAERCLVLAAGKRVRAEGLAPAMAVAASFAVAGPSATADADQLNAVQLLQDATQIAGVGGNGGSGNPATSGEVFGSASSGAGNGGNGSFLGSLVHASFALYDPVNIAVAGVNSSAHAEQTNTVRVDQAATQIAGVGGHGGSGNAALAGSVGALFSESGLIGSDVIAIGGGYAGDGGNGYFHGSVIDVDVAIYTPINIAVAGCSSTADAVQSNHALFDQSAIQIAGLGGDGGNANLALALHAVAEHHLLDHAL